MGNTENNNNNNNNNPVDEGQAPPQPAPEMNNNNNSINENNNNNNSINENNNNNPVNENNNNSINEAPNPVNENNNSVNEAPNSEQTQTGEPAKDDSDCPVPANLNEYQKHFSFDSLIEKIKETAKKAGLKAIYMALLLYYALDSPTISIKDKAIIYGALGYFISPIDIVPDILPLIGLSDDIAVLAWAFSRIKHNVTDMTREKAKTKLKIWFGNFDEKEIDDL